MSKHRIREIRERLGWSQAKLAEAVGLDATAISKLESGRKQLKAHEAEKIAMALDQDVSIVLGLDVSKGAGQQKPLGFSDDLVPYNPGPSDPFSGLQNANQYLFTVACDSLNRIGVNRGDVVLVDGSSEAYKKIKPLAIVRAQYHPDANHFGKAVSLLRQFVPPSLLITNSSAKNEMPIDTETEDAQIMGVVVSVHRALQG